MKRTVAALVPLLASGEHDVRVVFARERPTCSLYRLDVAARGEVMVKVRHPRIGGRAGAAAGRPMLNPEGAPSATDAARSEYDGLAFIDELLQQDETSRFLRVRPLHLAENDGVLAMEYLSLPTLKGLLTRIVRWAPGAMPVSDTVLRRAGEWLHLYHAADPPELPLGAASKLKHAAEVISVLSAFADYLGRHGVTEPQLRRIREAADVLEVGLPATFPCAIRHGDFSPRNVLVDAHNRIAVIDPMPRWMVPVYEEVATFLHGMRMSGLQVASQGLALRSDTLGGFERAFLEGYFVENRLPRIEVAAFKLLVLLDHWAGVVAVGGERPTKLRAARTAWWGSYYTRELERQMRELREFL